MRALLPGESLSDQCGHHCGIRSISEGGKGASYIGHCHCPECRCELAGGPLAENRPKPMHIPMCHSWGAGLDRAG